MYNVECQSRLMRNRVVASTFDYDSWQAKLVALELASEVGRAIMGEDVKEKGGNVGSIGMVRKSFMFGAAGKCKLR